MGASVQAPHKLHIKLTPRIPQRFRCKIVSWIAYEELYKLQLDTGADNRW